MIIEQEKNCQGGNLSQNKRNDVICFKCKIQGHTEVEYPIVDKGKIKKRKKQCALHKIS